MIEVRKIDKETWQKMFAENAHVAVFDERILKDKDCIDFALITIDTTSDKVVTYVTIREYDKDYAHWYWGGSFPDYRGTISAYRAMEAILDWMKVNYKKMSYFTQNTNYAMIKFGVTKKFQIVGMRLAKDGLLLEHVIEFDKLPEEK